MTVSDEDVRHEGVHREERGVVEGFEVDRPVNGMRRVKEIGAYRDRDLGNNLPPHKT